MITPKNSFCARFKNSLILTELFDVFRLAIILTTLFSIFVLGRYFFIDNEYKNQFQNEVISLLNLHKRHDLSKLVIKIDQKNSSTTTFKYQLINKQGTILAGKSIGKTPFHSRSNVGDKLTIALDNTDLLIVRINKTHRFKKLFYSILNFLLITLLVLIGLSLADLYFQRHTND